MDARESLSQVNTQWRTNLKATGKGPSLLESLESMLFKLCRRYVKLSREGMDNVYELETEKLKLRYEIRGLARAVAKIRLPYEDQPVIVKSVEKEFIRKAKR